MDDATAPPDDAGRLEAALSRIARHRSRAQPAVKAGGAGAGAAPIPPTLAARLDTLIADLRDVLGGPSAD